MPNKKQLKQKEIELYEIRGALKYKASAKKLFAYYDLEVEDKTDISFYAYLKMK